jgi:hypothetical protein
MKIIDCGKKEKAGMIFLLSASHEFEHELVNSVSPGVFSSCHASADPRRPRLQRGSFQGNECKKEHFQASPLEIPKNTRVERQLILYERHPVAQHFVRTHPATGEGQVKISMAILSLNVF